MYYGVFLRPGLPGDAAISSSPVGVRQLQNRLDPDTGERNRKLQPGTSGCGASACSLRSLDFRCRVCWSVCTCAGDERMDAFSLARGTGFTGWWTRKNCWHIKAVSTSVVRQGEPVSCLLFQHVQSPCLGFPPPDSLTAWTGWLPPSHLAFSVLYFNTRLPSGSCSCLFLTVF